MMKLLRIQLLLPGLLALSIPSWTAHAQPKNAINTENVRTITFSTYLGQKGLDYASSVATDPAGNIYVTGSTRASAGPLQSTEEDNLDIFIAKLSADGGSLIYLQYIGGSGDDYANDICVDQQGNAYITGASSSSDLPLISPIQSSIGGGKDAILMQLDHAGELAFSTYLGGTKVAEEGFGIACGNHGDVYITGVTNSPDFPLANPLDSTFRPNGTDIFVAKVNVLNSTLLYSTFFGGSLQDSGQAIAVDASGAAYVTGWTASHDFPRTTQLPYSGTRLSQSSPDAFIVKLSPDGSELMYSSPIGGSRADKANGIAVDGAGNAYIIGTTYSKDFPAVSASYGVLSGRSNAFAVKVESGGGSLAYSILFGGSASESGLDIAVDKDGNAYLSGSTDSKDLLLKPATSSKFSGGARDAFLVGIDPTGRNLLFSSYHGGALYDEGIGVAVDADGNLVLAGRTNSTNLQVTDGALQPEYAGGSFDAFVMKLSPQTCTSNNQRQGPPKCN